jgi:SNF2 family DNA or RNA helicase
MESYTIDVPLVKPILLLKNNIPTLKLASRELSIPDSDFGRWFLRAHYEHMNASPEAAEWFLRNDPASNQAIPGLIHTPHLYQRLALFRMKLSNTALWLDMGLGKTLLAIAYSLLQPKPFTLIICPLSVFKTWRDEIAKHIKPELNAQFVLAHGPKRNKVLANLRSVPAQFKTFVVTSYDTLETIRESLQQLPLCAVFFDEASRIKNINAARTKAAYRLAEALPDVPRFLMSGTPSTASVTGYYALYELLQKGATGCSSLFAFKHHFVEQKKFLICRVPDASGGERVVHIYADTAQRWLEKNYVPNTNHTFAQLGYTLEENPRPNCNHLKIMRQYSKDAGVKNIERLKQITQTHAYVLRKEDVLDQLPPKEYVTREVEMTEEQRKAYNDLLLTARTEIGSKKFSFRDSTSVFAKLHQIANGYLRGPNNELHYFKEQPKLDDLCTIIEEAGDQKIVVWCPWIPQLLAIQERLRAENIAHSLIYGKTSAKERETLIADFQQNKDCKLFVSNPSVGGLGLNLTCAHIEIFMSNWYQPDVRDQAEDRCHRQGQKNAVTIIDMPSENSIEQKILTTLRQKINLDDTILSPRDLGAAQ